MRARWARWWRWRAGNDHMSMVKGGGWPAGFGRLHGMLPRVTAQMTIGVWRACAGSPGTQPESLFFHTAGMVPRTDSSTPPMDHTDSNQRIWLAGSPGSGRPRPKAMPRMQEPRIKWKRTCHPDKPLRYRARNHHTVCPRCSLGRKCRRRRDRRRDKTHVHRSQRPRHIASQGHARQDSPQPECLQG